MHTGSKHDQRCKRKEGENQHPDFSVHGAKILPLRD
jgi:hypothetical protein